MIEFRRHEGFEKEIADKEMSQLALSRVSDFF